MGKKSVKLNYIYTTVFQIFSMITPLVTTPYVSRIFAADGIGQFSFSLMMNNYFCFFAALGFSIWGQREIARHQGDKLQQSITFFEILICKIIFGTVAFLACWMMISLGVFKEYTFLMKLLSLEIIATTFNISYFFQGNEKFGVITARDFIIKILSIALVFCFVKTPDHLGLYTLCHVGASLLSVLSLWWCVRKEITFVSIKKLNPRRHLVPSAKLFIPTIAISLFTIFDKLMIGFMVPGYTENVLADGTVELLRNADIENGYYVQSEKIIKMSMLVLASLGTVMLPRNAKELEDGNEERFLNNIKTAIQFVSFVGAPIMMGILAVAHNFSPWFFGEGFDKVPILLMMFSVMVLPSGLGNVLGQQYLLPKGEDNAYILTYVISGLFNVALNLILIPRFLSYGAAVATVAAEFLAPILMLFFIKRRGCLPKADMESVKAIIAALGMFIAVFSTSQVLSPSPLHTFILMFEGGVVYIILASILKCKMLRFALKFINRRRIGAKNNDV